MSLVLMLAVVLQFCCPGGAVVLDEKSMACFIITKHPHVAIHCFRGEVGKESHSW